MLLAAAEHHTAFYAATSAAFVFLIVVLSSIETAGDEGSVTIGRSLYVWSFMAVLLMAFGLLIPLAILAGYVSDSSEWRSLAFIAVTTVALWAAVMVGAFLSGRRSNSN